MFARGLRPGFAIAGGVAVRRMSLAMIGLARHADLRRFAGITI